ncbi:hypothetical protein Dsi01nite_110480 [Dactylosporangium siamense]|uniref:Fibronectin type-III domain-containing protein n=1 Tax=Dactylosporangium siamense TaxID=685454 RepID=A0A919UEV9_9ACTN|nr:hypothetical protein Dsi01nite_110480 [Dactylosporangium siamense]
MLAATIAVTAAPVVLPLPVSGAAGSDPITQFATGFNTPNGVAVDSAGNVYVADMFNHQVVRVTQAGVSTVIVGTGVAGSTFTGTGSTTKVNRPTAVAVDAADNVYVADYMNSKVLKVTPAGAVTVVAGTGTMGSTTPGQPATSADLNLPNALAVDGSGNLYIGDYGNNQVYRVSGGTLTLAAGNGAFTPAVPGTATASPLQGIYGLAVDGDGNFYIGDQSGAVVEKVTNPTSIGGGVLSIVAGTGVTGSTSTGTATTSKLNYPQGLAVDADGNLYIADTGNQVIRKVTPGGAISTVAGQMGADAAPTYGGAASASNLNYPYAVAADPNGVIYIADGTNNTVDRVGSATPSAPRQVTATPGGESAVVSFRAPASTGTSAISGYEIKLGAGVWMPATANSAGNGRLAVTLRGLTSGTPYTVQVRAVNSTGGGTAAAGVPVTPVTGTVVPPLYLSVVAGTGAIAPTNPGPATGSGLKGPADLAFDAAGNLYIADTEHCVVEKVTPAGTLSVALGTGTCARPVEGPAAASPLHEVGSIVFDNAGNMYVGDTWFGYVLKVTPGGTLSIIAGTGTPGAMVTGPALSSPLDTPSQFAIDGDILYLGERQRGQVGKINLLTGQLTVIAGTGTNGTPTPGTAATSQVNRPTGTAIDDAGNLYITSTDSSQLLKITPGGTLSVLAGSLSVPLGLKFDTDGQLYLSLGNGQIDRVDTTTGARVKVAGTGAPGTAVPGLALQSPLSAPYGLAFDPDGLLYAAIYAGQVVVKFTPGPAAPTGLSAAPGDTTALLTFTPGSARGNAITSYQVSTDNGATWTTRATTPGSGSTLQMSVPSLTNGTPYQVKVRAVNSIGAGEPTTAASVTPAGSGEPTPPAPTPTLPGAPTDLSATASGGTVAVTFTPPAGPVTRYEVSTDNGTTWTTLTTTAGTGATRAGTVPGLAGGTYQLKVRAVNGAGPGPATAAQAVTVGSGPLAPSGLTVTGRDTALQLAFTPPVGPVTRYEVSTDNGTTWTTLTTTAGTGGTLTGTVTGLTNGTTYPVKVRAINAAGTGPATAATNGTPAAPPQPPSGVTATAGTSAVTVSWSAAAAGAGTAAVTGYTVTASPGPATCSTNVTGPTPTSCVIGAVAGTTYTYTVVADSASGPSAPTPASAPTSAAEPQIPATVPDTQLTLTTDQGDITTAEPGEQIVVIGTGFAPYSTATITIYSSPLTLGTVVTDGNGNFSKPVTVPSSLTGSHTVIALGAAPDGSVRTMALEVTVAATPLAVTGLDVVAIVFSGLLALAAGVLLVHLAGAGRIRRTRLLPVGSAHNF